MQLSGGHSNSKLNEVIKQNQKYLFFQLVSKQAAILKGKYGPQEHCLK